MTEIIVASNSIITQTADLQNTILYTPSEDGLFFVRAYIENHGGWIATVLNYTDDFGPQSVSHNGLWSAALLIRARQATDISISAKVTSGMPTYSIYAVISQIS